MSVKSNRLNRLGLSSVVILIYAFLLLPVFIVVVTSFTTKTFPGIPTDGISLKWYSSLMKDSQLTGALQASIIVSTSAAIISAIVGSIAAIGFVRADFPYKGQISSVMLLPMIISPIITGIALIRYFGKVSVSSGYPSLIIGHTVLTIPYVFLLVRSELAAFDRDMERASRILGANSTLTFLNITGPIISPAILAGMFIAFVVSFGEFAATQFLISPDTSTVPVVIYTMLRTGLTPAINALATILIIVMVTLAFASRYLESST